MNNIVTNVDKYLDGTIDVPNKRLEDKIKELEEKYCWHDLKNDPPIGDDCVVLFPQISDVGILYTTSNPEYARKNALKNGYTHWFPVPKNSREKLIKEEIKILYNLNE